MSTQDIQDLFSQTLKQKLVGSDNISDVKVEISEETVSEGEMPWECSNHNEIRIYVKYGKSRKWRFFL